MYLVANCTEYIKLYTGEKFIHNSSCLASNEIITEKGLTKYTVNTDFINNQKLLLCLVCVVLRNRDRHTETQRETEIETETETDRDRDTETHRERDREGDRERQRQRLTCIPCNALLLPLLTCHITGYQGMYFTN